MDEQNDICNMKDEGNNIQALYDEEKKEVRKGRKVFRNVIMIISAALNVILFCFAVRSVNFTDASFMQVQKLKAVKAIITNFYYEDVDEATLIEGCIKGMTDSVNDVYTTYFTKKEMDSFTKSTGGSYEGLGISVALKEDGLITIVGTFDNSPAKKAGIQIRDKITKINGKDVTNVKKLDEAMPLLSGDLGDNIKLEILKADTNEKVEYDLKITEVEIKQISSEILDGDIGYIKIDAFNNDVSKYFKEYLEKLKEQNIKGLLVDVRDNLGGDYNEVIAIADSLLPKGSLIVYTIDKSKTKESEYAKEDGLDIPIGVLVNGESASASEVLAGALKDNKKAWLLGNKTYGKGVVQSVMEFKDGTGLKVTTSRYYTPSGVCIQGKGIEPDYKVDMPEEYENFVISDIPRENDAQLQEAVKIMKSEI